MENTNGKKTMGRRKIEIKKIEKKTNLQVTFTKRRRGLFRKASELAVLCGAEIAILVQSPAEKIFAFGQPSVAALINRAEAAEASLIPQFAARGQQIVLRCDDGRRECEEAAMMLEMERRKAAEKDMNQMMMVMGGMFWWEEPHEGLELHELQEFLKALEILEENVLQKAEECAKSKMMMVSEFAPSIQDFGASPSNYCALIADDDGGGDDYQDLFDLLNS